MDSHLLPSPRPRAALWRARTILPGLIVLLPAALACASSSGSRGPEPGQRISTTTISTLDGTTTLRTVEDIVVRGDTVPYPAARLWRHLADVYGELGVEPTVVDPSSYVLSDPALRGRGRLGGERLSRYLRCGRGMTGANADRYDITMQVVTQLVPVEGEGGTAVLSYVGGTARPSGLSTGAIDCASTGELENRIVAGLLARTAAGASTGGSR